MEISSQSSQTEAQLEIKSFRQLQEQLMSTLLRVATVVGLLAAIGGTLDSLDAGAGSRWTISLYWVSYAIILFLTFWRKAPYPVQAWALTGLLFILGATDFLDEGLNGSAAVFLVSAIFVASLLLGRRAGYIMISYSLLTMVTFTGLYISGQLINPDDIRSAKLGNWIPGIAVVLLASILITASLNYILPQLIAALNNSRKLYQNIQAHQSTLEQQVEERTISLQTRNLHLEAAAEVAREAAAIQDVEKLLDQTVHLISGRFGYYHTGIFLLDETKQYAVLRAASSEGGQRMIMRGHRLQVGETGIVGYVTHHGEPRISLDVSKDTIFFDNPDLPETRIEIALPLRANEEIIGALDIQSRQPEAIKPDDIAVLQTLADQIALAIQSASLFQQLQHSLNAERAAHGEQTREAWMEFIQGRQNIEASYDPQGILTGTDENASISVPVKVRNQIIGTIRAAKSPDQTGWTTEEAEIIDVLSNQLGIALDSARVFEETQQRAQSERIISEAATRMRETLDIESVMKTAAEEIRRALELPEVVIRLGHPNQEQKSKENPAAEYEAQK